MGARQRRRHAAAAAAFVDAHLPPIWRYLATHLGDVDRARDAVREVLGSVDPRLLREDDPAVIRRLLLVRARRAVATAAPTHDPPSAPPAARVVAAGLADLDETDRDVVVLVDVVGADPAEVAGLCELSMEEIGERRHQAHRRLVERLVGPDR